MWSLESQLVLPTGAYRRLHAFLKLIVFRFTYAISFAALIVGAAAEAAYWTTPKGIEAGVLFFLIPLILVIINALGIEVCNLGWEPSSVSLTDPGLWLH
jgi:hypothetical protein